MSFLLQYVSLTNNYYLDYVDHDKIKLVPVETPHFVPVSSVNNSVAEVTKNETIVDMRDIFPPNRTSAELHSGEDDLAKEIAKHIRILCLILTQPNNHNSKAIHVMKTWAKRCTVAFFVSTQPFANHTTIVFPKNESRNILWGKTKLGFKHAYDQYFDQADWFVKADDDTYMIMENLRFMLLDKDPAAPVYFGCKYKPHVSKGYMSGGAGYVLSKEALRRFVEESLPNSQLCKQTDDGSEDVEMGLCLQHVGVEASDSRDQEGRARFFPFVPHDHVVPNDIDLDFWYWKYIWYPHEQGIECCSDSVIAFHYVDKNLLWTLEYFVYHVHPFGIHPQLTGSTVKDKILRYLSQRNLREVKKNVTAVM